MDKPKTFRVVPCTSSFGYLEWMGGGVAVPVAVGEAIAAGGPSETYAINRQGCFIMWWGGSTQVPHYVFAEISARRGEPCQ